MRVPFMSAEPSVLHLPASRHSALLRPGMLALLLFSVGHFAIDMYSGAIGRPVCWAG